MWAYKVPNISQSSVATIQCVTGPLTTINFCYQSQWKNFNKSAFSLDPRLSTWRCPHLLLWTMLRSRCCWVLVPDIDQYVLPAGHTHEHPFNGPLSGTTRVSRYQKGKTNLDFTEATVSGSGICWAICKSAPRFRQITSPAPHHSVFLQAGCPSCSPTNSVKALKAILASGALSSKPATFRCCCWMMDQIDWRQTVERPTVTQTLLHILCWQCQTWFAFAEFIEQFSGKFWQLLKSEWPTAWVSEPSCLHTVSGTMITQYWIVTVYPISCEEATNSVWTFTDSVPHQFNTSATERWLVNSEIWWTFHRNYSIRVTCTF